MTNEDVHDFLYMMYELKMGKPVYAAPCDFSTDFNSLNIVGCLNDQGTDIQDTVYIIDGYNDPDIVDVIIRPKDGGASITVPKIKTCYAFDLNNLPVMRTGLRDLAQKITYFRAVVDYFESKPEAFKTLRMFEDNNDVVRRISNRSNFKLSDIQPILDIMST